MLIIHTSGVFFMLHPDFEDFGAKRSDKILFDILISRFEEREREEFLSFRWHSEVAIAAYFSQLCLRSPLTLMTPTTWFLWVIQD